MDTRGSITVETAVIFPVVMTALLFGYACIVLCVNYFMIGVYFNKTAEQLSDYAYIYNEKLISKYSSDIRSSVKTEVNNKLDELFSKIPEAISGLIDIKGYIEDYEDDFLDRAEDQIYIPIAHRLFNTNLLGSGYNITDVDFSRSEFFHKNNEILLNMQCRIKFPLVFFNNTGIDMSYKLRTNAWLNGVGKEDETGGDIWALNNFDRGRKIRKLFGANLPDNFPVIAGFKENRAIMIKSLDYRKESYQNDGAVSKAVQNMLNKLSEFKGRETPYGKDKIVINTWDIKEKELILVIPKDEQNEIVISELRKAEAAAENYGIIFTVKKL